MSGFQNSDSIGNFHFCLMSQEVKQNVALLQTEYERKVMEDEAANIFPVPPTVTDD